VLEEHVTHAGAGWFHSAVERNELRFAEICERFEISRKTGYKWLARYKESGPAGLLERSRRPHHSPNATPRRWPKHLRS